MLKKEQVEKAQLAISAGAVEEMTSMKELGAFLGKDEKLLK